MKDMDDLFHMIQFENGFNFVYFYLLIL